MLELHGRRDALPSWTMGGRIPCRPERPSATDCRVSYIDTTTFADYRTEYFKGNDKTKVIDRDWGSFDLPDKRALYWKYWYGKDLKTGFETWAVIPKAVVRKNSALPASLWSEETLTKLKQ